MRIRIILVLALLVGCDRAPPPTAPRAVERGGARITVSDAVVAAAGITTTPARRMALDRLLELSGEVASDPDRVATIAAPAPGRIRRVLVAPGETVQRDQALVEVQIPDLSRLRADLAAREAQERTARQTADRTSDLYAEGAASEKDAAQARARADALEARARSAAEVLRALGAATTGIDRSTLTLRAPIAGQVLSRAATAGQLASAEQPLLAIADLSAVWFVARAYERDLARLRVGQVARVILNAFPGRVFTGTVATLAGQVDPATHAVLARIPLDNADGLLRVGLFGIARVHEGNRDESQAPIVTAEAAVVDLRGVPVVFVQVGDSAFEPRPVVLGKRAAGAVELRSGVREGELVVDRGSFNLKSVALRETHEEE